MIPTSQQLTAARALQWHQSGEALQTIEGMRNWLNRSGLVLFTPHPQQLGAPAGSFVEAMLGANVLEPELAQIEEAKSLLSRLIVEGTAIPLNLLGGPGETPDFIVSASVFAYLFTLRGDKAWKQAPQTSGPVKVSPLALAAYEALVANGEVTAYALAGELGREVTEAAVLRSLVELWNALRVLPVSQPDGAATKWELTTTRFTKQMKAGANAGQPTALSAMISLYLAHALLATEEEIETFLSPLAARSRVRSVLHDLIGARQLDTLAVDGRTLLHVAGALPAFAAGAVSAGADGDVAEETEGLAEGEATAEGQPAVEGETPRITKFIPKPRKVGTGFVPRLGRNAPGGAGFKGAPAGGERERRPFVKRDSSAGFDRARPSASGPRSRSGSGFSKPGFSKPSFDKPWEEKRTFSPAPGAEEDGGGEGRPAKTFERRPSSGGMRPSGRSGFGAKPSFGGGPSRGFGGGSARGDSDRPKRTFSSAPREGFTPRAEGGTERPAFGGSSEGRPPRKTFSKPGTFGRKREGGFSGGGEGRPPRREFTPHPDGESRPPRREFTPRPDGEGRPPRREFTPRPGGDSRPPRRDFAPRSPGGFGGGEGRPSRPSFGDRSGGGERRTFKPRDGSEGGSSSGPREGSGAPAKRVFRKFDAPRFEKREGGDRPSRPYTPKPFGGPRSAAGGDRPERLARPERSDRPARSGSFDGPKRPYTPRAEGAGGPESRTGFKRAAKPFGSKPGGFKKPGGGSAGFAAKGGPFAKFADGKKPFRKPGKPAAKPGAKTARRKPTGGGE